MEASSPSGTTRRDAGQPDASVRNEHTQLRLDNKEEQKEFNKTLEQEGEVLVPEVLRSERRSQNFQEPTLEEVTAYCRHRGNAIDPEQFRDLIHTPSRDLSGGRNRFLYFLYVKHLASSTLSDLQIQAHALAVN